MQIFDVIIAGAGPAGLRAAEILGNVITVKGPKGELKMKLHPDNSASYFLQIPALFQSFLQWKRYFPLL